MVLDRQCGLVERLSVLPPELPNDAGTLEGHDHNRVRRVEGKAGSL